jgi:hypothetical protein
MLRAFSLVRFQTTQNSCGKQRGNGSKATRGDGAQTRFSGTLQAFDGSREGKTRLARSVARNGRKRDKREECKRDAISNL